MSARDLRHVGQWREPTGSISLRAWGIEREDATGDYTFALAATDAAFEEQGDGDYLLTDPPTGAKAARIRQRDGGDVLIYEGRS